MKNRNKADSAKFTLSPWQALFLTRTFNHWAKQIDTNHIAVLTFNEETGRGEDSNGKFGSNLQVRRYRSTNKLNASRCVKALVDAAISWYLLRLAFSCYPRAKGTCTSQLNKAIFIQLFAILFLMAEGTTEHLSLCSPPLHELYDQRMNNFFLQRLASMSPQKRTTPKTNTGKQWSLFASWTQKISVGSSNFWKLDIKRLKLRSLNIESWLP